MRRRPRSSAAAMWCWWCPPSRSRQGRYGSSGARWPPARTAEGTHPWGGGGAGPPRRIILSWHPAALRDFLERHAYRAHVEGSPADESAQPLPTLGPARYVVVSPSRRPAALRDALDALDPRRPYIWRGGPVTAPGDAPDAVLCALLPTRAEFAALARLGAGAPVLFPTAAQLPYVRSLARPLTPRSEEHTSELQSPCNLVCRLLLEK